MRRIAFLILFIAAVAFPVSSRACSAIIISGKYTADGKPLMMKTRDQGSKNFNTNIKYYTGGKYDYIAMGPTPWIPAEQIKSTGGGMNAAGLCMAGLTSHSFPDDTIKVPGRSLAILEKYALANFKSIAEFDAYLATLSHPLGIHANLGVIDAFGDAAFYEFGNDTWVKYDVNDPVVAPEGYRCCTNFSFSGDRPEHKSRNRYDDCIEIMRHVTKNAEGKYVVTPAYLVDECGRSFVNVTRPDFAKGGGMVSDEGLISHYNTSNIIVFQGVPAGSDPRFCVMWTALGHPKCSPAIPLIASLGNTIPDYIDCPPEKFAPIFKDVMKISDEYLYTDKRKGNERMFNADNALALRPIAVRAEEEVNAKFLPLYAKWEKGEMTDEAFLKAYRKQLPAYYKIFRKRFAKFL